MIHRCGDHAWPSVAMDRYKDEPGTWMQVTRRVLVDSEQTQFQVRYFEVEAGGYTSFERHQHEHAVVVLRGRGTVRLGDQVDEIQPGDVVHVASNVPHQFSNPFDELFGILCIVDRDRDRPVLLDPPAASQSSNS